MGAIKDIIDLVQDLESRTNDRRNMDTVHSINALALSLQTQHAEIIERDVELMQQNAKLVADKAKLEHQLAEAQSEEIRIHNSIEFRKGKRTGGKWAAFCPKCHLPTCNVEGHTDVGCSDTKCGWSVLINSPMSHVLRELGA